MPSYLGRASDKQTKTFQVYFHCYSPLNLPCTDARFDIHAEPSHKRTVITYAAISQHSPPRYQSTAHLDLKLFSC